jgi:hypothetical protein
MTRLFLPYNKTILKINIIFSVVLTFLSSLLFLAKKSIHSPVYLIIVLFTFWIMTGGFLLSAYYFEISRSNEYYFYYNLGLSKIKLLLITYTLHVIKGIILTDHDYRNVLEVATRFYLLFDGGLKPIKTKEDLIDWGYVPDNK